MDAEVGSLLRRAIPLAALFFLIDIPWLYSVGPWTQSMVRGIQGGAPFQMRWTAAPVVYLALGILLQFAHSVKEAVVLGLATYAVYDFTNYATLAKYDLQFGMVDR